MIFLKPLVGPSTMFYCPCSCYCLCFCPCYCPCFDFFCESENCCDGLDFYCGFYYGFVDQSLLPPGFLLLASELPSGLSSELPSGMPDELLPSGLVPPGFLLLASELPSGLSYGLPSELPDELLPYGRVPSELVPSELVPFELVPPEHLPLYEHSLHVCYFGSCGRNGSFSVSFPFLFVSLHSWHS